MGNEQMNAGVYAPPVQGRKGVTGSTIKIIAVVTMLIDHLAAALLTRIIYSTGYLNALGDGQSLYRWLSENGLLFFLMTLMRLIGRLGFPLFCFLLVEGFQKTRSVAKYAFRLGLFALISEIPFDLAFSGRVWAAGYQNVYFTLLMGILALWAFDTVAKLEAAKWLRGLLTVGGILLLPFYVALRLNRGIAAFLVMVLRSFSESWGQYSMRLTALAVSWVVLTGVMLVVWGIYKNRKGGDKAWRMCANMAALAVAMGAADFLRTDYGGMGVLTIAVIYALRKNKVLSMTGGCVTLTIMSISEVTAFFALIPIACYNGERGLKMKYFFYLFYPVHLFIIWLICAGMGLGWMSAI